MKPLFAISLFTFRELLRERILYNVFFISLFLIFFGYLAALLVYGHQDRVMLHFGTLMIALSLFTVGVSAASRIIRSEIDLKSIQLVLVRPISRVTYFYGKWLGIGIFIWINLLLLFGVLWLGLYATGGEMNSAIVQSMTLIGVEALLIAALSLSLSLHFRPGLTAMIAFAYFFLAHNHDQLKFLEHHSEVKTGFFFVLSKITPNCQIFLMDTRAYYRLPLSMVEMAERLGYGLFWILFFMLIGNAIFYRKNL